MGGRVTFPAVTTTSAEIHLLAGESRSSSTFSGAISTLPIGVAKVSIPGISGFASVTSTDPVVLSCVDGPSMSVDGKIYRARLKTTVAELASGRPVGRPGVSGPILDKGEHRVQVLYGVALRPADLLLERPGLGGAGADDTVLLSSTFNANAGWQASLPDGGAAFPWCSMDGAKGGPHPPPKWLDQPSWASSPIRSTERHGAMVCCC